MTITRTLAITLSGLLLALPTAGAELTVAAYVDITIARLELAKTSWGEQGQSPGQAKEDELFERYGTTAESYYAFPAFNRREIDAYLDENEELKDAIESLSESIRQLIEQAEEER